MLIGDTAARVIVSITFDDAIDDVHDDDPVDVPDDDVFVFSRDFLTDGDEVVDKTCAAVDLDAGIASGPDAAVQAAAENVHCDLPAVYYVNWPRVNERSVVGSNVKWSYLTTAMLQDLESWGHEIGGHSAHHHVVPQLESASESLLQLDEQRLQICADRKLISVIPKKNSPAASFLVNSFAYPFGEYTWQGDAPLKSAFGDEVPDLTGDETRNIVGAAASECAYRNARATGGVANSAACLPGGAVANCVWGEVLPLSSTQKWWIRTPSSVTNKTELAYPPTPAPDTGAPGYDSDTELQQRAHSIEGWIDNAIARLRSSAKVRSTPGRATEDEAVSQLTSPLTAGCPGRKVVVSLTFDDGVDSSPPLVTNPRLTVTDDDIAWHARHTLRTGGATDLPATFYVNRPRIQHTGAFSLANLHEVLGFGHELGGHTAHHLDMSTIVTESTNEVRRQICWDRNELTGITRPTGGTYDVWDLAYPFGAYSATGHATTVRSVAGEDTLECGQYLSARATGGVADTPDCTDTNPATPCDVAEVLPVAPSYRYRIRTPSSIKCKTGLATIQSWIANAVAAACPPDTTSSTEQWWVIPVLHRIRAANCSASSNPEDFGILDSDFISLAAWRRANASQLEFKTMHDALDPGAAEKAVSLPTYISTRTAVANSAMTDDLPSPGDGLTDRYQASGALNVSRGQESGGNWFTRLQTSAGADSLFITRRDLNTSALRITSPGGGAARYYQVQLRHRLHPSGGSLASAVSYVPSDDEDDTRDLIDPEGTTTLTRTADSLAPASATDSLALLGAVRMSFLQSGGPSVSGSPDGFEDAFWSSAPIYAPGSECTTVTFEPSTSWQTVTGLVKINGVDPARRRRDAMSFGIMRNSKTNPVDVDVDDFSFCVCEATAVNSVPACASACTLPSQTCP